MKLFVDKCGVPAISGMVPQLSSRISGGRAVTIETTAWHVILRENEKVFLQQISENVLMPSTKNSTIIS